MRILITNLKHLYQWRGLWRRGGWADRIVFAVRLAAWLVVCRDAKSCVSTG
jgi:hypothetical protein